VRQFDFRGRLLTGHADSLNVEQTAGSSVSFRAKCSQSYSVPRQDVSGGLLRTNAFAAFFWKLCLAAFSVSCLAQLAHATDPATVANEITANSYGVIYRRTSFCIPGGGGSCSGDEGLCSTAQSTASSCLEACGSLGGSPSSTVGCAFPAPHHVCRLSCTNSTGPVCPDGYYYVRLVDGGDAWIGTPVRAVCAKWSPRPSLAGLDPGRARGKPACRAGNPCNVATGGKYDYSLDYRPEGVGPFSLERSYNSVSPLSRALQVPWTPFFEQRLVLGVEGSTLQVAHVIAEGGAQYLSGPGRLRTAEVNS
jgi:hypothetical protein